MTRPTIAEALTLQPGQLAAVTITTPDGDETIWVSVTDNLDAVGYVGRMITDPVHLPLKFGDELAFKVAIVQHVGAGSDPQPMRPPTA
jgi:hypothetical protein